MEAQFWIDSWHSGGAKTSFHRRDIHPYLEAPVLPEHDMAHKFGLRYLKEHDFLLTKKAAGHLN